MTGDQRQKNEARIRAIRIEIANIPALLDGTLMSKRNRVKRKDGSLHVSPEHWTFQYRSADGKRQWKRIPRPAKAVVQRLVRAGEHYRALEQEYRALLTELALADGGKKKRLILSLPRPTFAHVEAVLRAIEEGPVDASGFPVALQDLDKALATAAQRDAGSLLSEVLSHLGKLKMPGAHGYRVRQLLTCLGWIPVHYAYVRKAGASAFLQALGVAARSTAAARDRAVRCAALCGSFAEGGNVLGRLTGMVVSITKLRAMTLAYGDECLQKQAAAKADVRSYPERTPKEGETPTEHTFFCRLDGTGAPCTQADTAGRQGKNGEAGTRQIRVAVFGEYAWLDPKGRPAAFRGSFSCAVSGEEIAEVGLMVRKLGRARGCGNAARIQCVADGEEALEKALRDAFPNAIFTNDFMHACEHLHLCCQNLGLAPEATGKEYRFLKGLLYRCGAAAVIQRLETRYLQPLAASSAANKELDYLRKRQQNMRYGKLRKDGLFIASGHVEAAARVLVVRRCKQAGMHWRHNNAIRISAILAHFRSVA